MKLPSHSLPYICIRWHKNWGCHKRITKTNPQSKTKQQKWQIEWQLEHWTFLAHANTNHLYLNIFELFLYEVEKISCVGITKDSKKNLNLEIYEKMRHATLNLLGSTLKCRIWCVKLRLKWIHFNITKTFIF